MENYKNKEMQNRATKAAKAIKDGADTAFDTVQNAVEAVESAAMNTVDKTTDYINKRLDNDNQNK